MPDHRLTVPLVHVLLFYSKRGRNLSRISTNYNTCITYNVPMEHFSLKTLIIVLLLTNLFLFGSIITTQKFMEEFNWIREMFREVKEIRTCFIIQDSLQQT